MAPNMTPVLVACILLASGGAQAWSHPPSESATAVCTGSAMAAAKTKGFQLIFRAVADVAVQGCSASTDTHGFIQTAFAVFKPAAVKLVSTWTRVTAQCATTGNAYGCAQADAEADAQAKALIDVYVTAAAKAINSCSQCGPDAITKVEASTSSALIAEIIASAKSMTSAHVCVGPNTVASAYAECAADVVARGFALVFARAFISGGCTNLRANALAVTSIYARTDPHCACIANASVCTGASCPGVIPGGGMQRSYRRAYAYFRTQCSATDTAVTP